MTQTFPQDELTMVSIRNPLNTCIFAPMVEINPYQQRAPDMQTHVINASDDNERAIFADIDSSRLRNEPLRGRVLHACEK